MLPSLFTDNRANLWRQQQPAPKVQVVQPTEPISYVRLSWWLGALFMLWAAGTIIAKHQPAPKAPAATEAPPVDWPHVGRWPAPYQSDDTHSL